MKRLGQPYESASAIDGLSGDFGAHGDVIRDRDMQPPPPPPLIAPASRGALAARRLLKDSREYGNEWLSEDDIYKMIKLFQDDDVEADFYLLFADHGSESLIQKWVRRQLAQSNASL